MTAAGASLVFQPARRCGLDSLRRLDGTGLDVATGDPPSHPSRGRIPNGESDMSDTKTESGIHDTDSFSLDIPPSQGGDRRRVGEPRSQNRKRSGTVSKKSECDLRLCDLRL